MTPFIDVMLVLPTIFIITIPWQTHAVNIDIPSAPLPSEQMSPDVIKLSIDFDGSIAWNGTIMDHNALTPRISRAASQSCGPTYASPFAGFSDMPPLRRRWRTCNATD